MEYLGKTYSSMGQVYSKALDIAENNPSEACNFLKAYTQAVFAENKDCHSMEEALAVAKSNLGYFSGYGSAESAKLIYKTFNLCHPIFN